MNNSLYLLVSSSLILGVSIVSSPLQSLVASGTKLWLDSIDPELIQTNKALGATGATSNPIIISDLLKSGRFDEQLLALGRDDGLNAEASAWRMTDKLVREAQAAFQPVWEETRGNDGYVSFELDPLLEDLELGPRHNLRVEKYIELAKKWAEGHTNRMIKIPATPAGLESLEPIVAAGATVNVTLIFSMRQYLAAREAVWRGAQQRVSLEGFKSVYSIFVSRVDVYTEKRVPSLLSEAQGLVGIVGAKKIWAENQTFWKQHPTPLQQEIIFASTGTKKPSDPAWKYVEALAGSDIQTNPPGTNAAIEASDTSFTRNIDTWPSDAILQAIALEVNPREMEATLMKEGIEKFAAPHKALIALIEEKQSALGLVQK